MASQRDAHHAVAAPDQRPTSRLPEIWETYSAKLKRIDDVEKRLNERANRTRRRLANILHEESEYRTTHSRLFITHQVENSKQHLSTFKLIIEGRLLIDNLDHESATNADDEAAAAAKAVDNKNKLVGDMEEEPVKPVLFSHLFEEIVVEFQTVYQPIQSSAPAPVPVPESSPSKKSRAGKRKTPIPLKPEEPTPLDPSQCKASGVQRLTWNNQMSPDANAVIALYPNHYSERPPPPGFKFNFVVAMITLHPSRPQNVYQPAPALARALFPKHLNERTLKKRIRLEGGGVGEMADANKPVAFENDIHIPLFLTMDEITSTFFQYIVDKGLMNPNEKSEVTCDKVLSNLLDLDNFNFSQLQQVLRTKELITQIQPKEEPVIVTYLMHRLDSPIRDSNSTVESFLPSTSSPPLTFDLNVTIKGLFHYRIRELMRRVKKREFEYTSSRTKARYLLVSTKANEELVKSRIETVVTGRGFEPANIPICLALAKAALPDSEARVTYQTDAKICALIERLGEATKSAEFAWDTVNFLLGENQDKTEESE